MGYIGPVFFHRLVIQADHRRVQSVEDGGISLVGTEGSQFTTN